MENNNYDDYLQPLQQLQTNTWEAFQQIAGLLNLQGQQLTLLVQALQQQVPVMQTLQPPQTLQTCCPHLPNPEKYDHSDLQLYLQFHLNLQAKLACDADTIGDACTCTWFTFQCLAGTVMKRIHPWMELTQNTPEDFTQENLLLQMDTTFDDPNHQVCAASKLHHMCQSG